MNLTRELSSKTGNTTFGGLILESDFNTDYRGKDRDYSSVARRIMDDWKFDKQCKTLGENNKKMKLNKKGN